MVANPKPKVYIYKWGNIASGMPSSRDGHSQPFLCVCVPFQNSDYACACTRVCVCTHRHTRAPTHISLFQKLHFFIWP